ncbi:interleukin-17A-like [Polyodon spathula]|uniref:interleukin-17A-like n=1 Tax=Polyodon spathula TaxID=7913 RepID=UPI001B7E43B7|nr:interleukin-17A-like [Polyodon spathula]
MLHLKTIQIYCLTMLTLSECKSIPLSSKFTGDPEGFNYQLVNILENKLPLNERSLAPWTYENNVDLNRVPQVIQQAKCNTSHHCVIRNEDQETKIHSLETIPFSVSIPVLRKNQHSEYDLEFETMQVACICVTSRNSDPKKLSDIMSCMA